MTQCHCDTCSKLFLRPLLVRRQGVSVAVSPDLPVTCLLIITPPPKALYLACHRRSSEMRTTTTTPIPPLSRRTQRTLPALMVSLPHLVVGGQVQRSPGLSIPLPCHHDYSTRPLTTITTTIISSSSSIMQRNSSKEPWLWTCMNRSVFKYLVSVKIIGSMYCVCV